MPQSEEGGGLQNWRALLYGAKFPIAQGNKLMKRTGRIGANDAGGYSSIRRNRMAFKDKAVPFGAAHFRLESLNCRGVTSLPMERRWIAFANKSWNGNNRSDWPIGGRRLPCALIVNNWLKRLLLTAPEQKLAQGNAYHGCGGKCDERDSPAIHR